MSEIAKEYRFPEDRFEALKEAQRLSGLTQQEFDCLLKAFSKGFDGQIGFGRPDEFFIYLNAHSLALSLTFNFDKGLTEKMVKFRFSFKELGLSDVEPDFDWRNNRLHSF